MIWQNAYREVAESGEHKPLRLSNRLFPKRGILLGLVYLTLILTGYRCEHRAPSKYNENLPPETSIFISTEKELNPTQSVQTISWDGRDPDGFVIGFYYTWKENPDSNDWIFTKAHSQTFSLKISGTDTVYTFQIKAMDDDSLCDPTPARQSFRIKNSAPRIWWNLDSRIPDTTYTVATFSWSAADLDGDSTIIHFEYALDDTSHWVSIPGSARSVTLKASDGLTEGNHCFYIRAVDIAGTRSNVIRMPDNPSQFWYVREPQGRYLLIDDHNSESATLGFPDKFYKSMLADLVGSFNYWNIEKLFPSSLAQFKETLKLFDRIIWYTDLVKVDDSHFIAAQVAIPEARNQGAKVMYLCQFNTGFGDLGDPLAFTPVDSLKKYYDRIFTPGVFKSDTADFKSKFPNAPALPELKVSSNIFGAFAVTAKSGSINLYRYEDKAVSPRPLFVILGRNDNTGVYDFVFSGAPLHQLNGNNNLKEFFNIILNYVF